MGSVWDEACAAFPWGSATLVMYIAPAHICEGYFIRRRQSVTEVSAL